ncbi:hypothetical protein EDB84DRAFT_223657 [Lactarius hengduanensis]|nr:hypothetical protein EDB84DRAFT_223657 [Lactarius hengduanensis]
MRNVFCTAAATVHGPSQPLQSLRSTLPKWAACSRSPHCYTRCAVRMARPFDYFSSRSTISGVSGHSRKCIYCVALSLLGSLYLRSDTLSVSAKIIVFVSYIPCPLPIIVSYSRSFSPCSLILASIGHYDLVNLVFSPRERHTPHEAPVPFISFFAVFIRRQSLVLLPS